MVHCAFDSRVELDNVDREASTLGKTSEFVIDWFNLDGIQRQECGLTGSVSSQMLDSELARER